MNRWRWLLVALVTISSLAVAVAHPLKAQSIMGEHRVLPGETLYCIGRGYGVMPAAIALTNGLSPFAHLSVGQILRIPAAPWASIPPGPVCAPQFTPAGSGTAQFTQTTDSTARASQIYVVRRGDSLWRIGRLFGVSVAALKAANNLQGNIIYVGQQLIIPGLPGVPPTPTAIAQVLPTDAPAPAEPPPADTSAPPAETAAPEPTATTQPPPVVPSETATATSTVEPSKTSSVPSDTPASPTNTPTPTATATLQPGNDPLLCAVPNIAWSQLGQLLRGARPEADAFTCLAAAGVDAIVDLRVPSEDNLGEPDLALQAGIDYVNLGITDDTAPSPTILRAWIDTVEVRLAAGQIVLVHDAAGRGRIGLWDAVYFMRHGATAAEAVEDRYLAKALLFTGAAIGCSDGGNGQVQALAEIGQILTGATYYPALDEYGTTWSNCPRPAYMAGWDYAAVLP